MSTRDFSWGKGGRCLRLTTSPPSRAECNEIWEPRPPGTLWATFVLIELQQQVLLPLTIPTVCPTSTDHPELPAVVVMTVTPRHATSSCSVKSHSAIMPFLFTHVGVSSVQDISTFRTMEMLNEFHCTVRGS
jgi:hypothetical protein